MLGAVVHTAALSKHGAARTYHGDETFHGCPFSCPYLICLLRVYDVIFPSQTWRTTRTLYAPDYDGGRGLRPRPSPVSGPAPVTHGGGGGSNNTEGDVSRKSNMARKKRDRISVVKEIDSAEERLQSCRNSLEEVDYRLRKDELTEEGR
ncbi:hypothetical protein GDO81_022667 [Engystomops pustulosus]|uniref:Uncharacterized protein n=1 Tax=Engystomops pustulosus TaxID=76066 RepID=A0AAV6ZAQ7_ENGPU|nr:hypothetical protein GDO81_022667 [Engystomops pustulosus]